MMDSRAGRVLRPAPRPWSTPRSGTASSAWTRGSFDHLLLGTSLPAFLGRGMHFIEAWNEAVCEGAWGRTAARVGERIRRAVDLEHWAAFGDSLRDLEDLLERIASGRHGERARDASSCSPATSTTPTSRDAAFASGNGDRSPVYQAVCSPMRNPLDSHERRAIRIGDVARRPSASAARSPVRPGWREESLGWTIEEGPVVRQPGRDARARRPPRMDGPLDKTRGPAGRPAAPRAGDAPATVLTRQSG